MKDNIREALFNLVGGWVKDKVVFDLFAGTGAMGLEALSRGAAKCFFVERHIPTVRLIEGNVLGLDPDLPVEINSSDSFFWVRQFLKSPDQWPAMPWVVFCCPPYDFYVERKSDVLNMIGDLLEIAPQGSIFVVESDARFDPGELPESDTWVVRKYSPALVAVRRERPSDDDEQPSAV
jgi:16S rRNA (guanine966-N2)-methyltransferase